jgi:small subunit ribosomal protein S3
LTTYGIIGVKVWIFKGEVLGGLPAANAVDQPAPTKKKGRNAKREG